MRSFASRLVGLVVALSTLGITPAVAQDRFQEGDVFVAVGKDSIEWRGPDGSLRGTLQTAVSTPQPAGLALDEVGRLYAVGFTSNVINRFTVEGTPDGVFGADFESHPESIAFDRVGHALVGQEAGTRDILEFDAGGRLVARHDALSGARGTDRIDVGLDQCTVMYTSEDRTVRRFDRCLGVQLPDLTAALPGTRAHDVRILPGGGVLVADTQAIHQLNATGAITRSYDAPSANCWTALAVGVNATGFVAGDRCAKRVYRFDIGSTTPVASFPTGAVNGLAVAGGFVAASPPPGADLSVVQTDEPDPVTSDHRVHYEASISNEGPLEAASPVLSVAVSAGVIEAASGAGWSCAVTDGLATCSGPDPLPLGTTTIDVVVRVPDAQEPTSVTSSASIEAASFEPDPSDNGSAESTAVLPAGAGGDRATSYIPPEGGTVSTNRGDGATTNDNTYGQATFPVGPGGVASVIEDPQRLTVCLVVDCAGAAVDFIVPDGYVDPENPIVIHVVYHSTVAPPNEDPRTVYVEKIVAGEKVITIVPPCDLAGIASPSPCLDGQERVQEGDALRIRILMLSGDPKYQG